MNPGCERCRRLLSLSWDRPLDGAEEKALQAHLDRCPACRSFREDLERVLPGLEKASLPGTDPSRLAALVSASLPGRRKPIRGIRTWGFAAAGALAAAALLFFFLVPGPATRPRPAPVLRIEGQARAWKGGRISTPALEGRAAALFLADGSLLDLWGGTEILFSAPAKGERVHILLEKGRLAAYVSHRPGRFLVETGAGSAEALGTCFEVEVEPPRPEGEKPVQRKKGAGIPGTVMKVAVLAGSVLVHSAWGRVTLEAGQEKEITTWSARGRVVDEKGRPVKGVRIWVDNGEPFQSMAGSPPPAIPWRTFHPGARFSNRLWLGPFTAGPAVTGREGRFLVPNVASPLKGRILLLHPDFLERAVPVNRKWVVRDGVVDAGTIRLERGLSVSGRVLKSDGSPAAGAWVALAFDRSAMNYQDQPGALRMTRAGRGGRFRIGGIDPAWKGLVLGCWEEEGLPLEKPLDLGGNLAGLKLVLPAGRGLTLSVKVLQAPGGGPFPGTVGLVYGARDPALAVPLARSVAGPGGNLLFKGLPPGKVQLVLVPPDQAGKIGSWSRPPYSWRGTVPAGSTRVCRLDPPVGIQGRVVDALTGKPVERFRLEARPDPSWFDRAYRERFGHPDEPSLPGGRFRRGGLFRLPTLRAGKWRIFACANGYHPLERNLELPPRGTGEVLLPLEPAGGTLRGVVVDSSGTPLEGSLVEGYEWSPRRYGLNRRRKTAGPGGAFLLDRLLLDTKVVLKVWIRKKGYLAKEIVFEAGEPRPASLGRVTLQRECVLTGRIVDAAGNPLDRLRLRLYAGSFRGKGGRAALTDRKGRFVFKGLPPGRYRLVLEGRKLAEVELPRPGAKVELPCKVLPRKGR